MVTPDLATARAMMLGDGGHARALRAGFQGTIERHVHPGGDLDDDQALALDPAEWVVINGLGFLGTHSTRKVLFERFTARGFYFPIVVHPSAAVDADVRRDAGSQIMIGASVVSGAHIGENAIVNTGAVVDHDTTIGNHSHVAPGAVLCGGVRVGSETFIGAGAIVLPGVVIGNDAIVGAGAVVRTDVPDGVTVVGVPASPTRKQPS